jgi:hypothetical protein
MLNECNMGWPICKDSWDVAGFTMFLPLDAYGAVALAKLFMQGVNHVAFESVSATFGDYGITWTIPSRNCLSCAY